VLTTFQSKRPSVAALLDHAQLVSTSPGSITLAFSSRVDAERAEKARGEIEQVVSGVLGQPTRMTFDVAEPAGRSGVEEEAEDRKNREAEARQHPMIRRAQDVFGASLKEIKT
jgi:hypothetical protein